MGRDHQQRGLLKMHRIAGASPDLDMICGRFHYNRASLLFAALPPYLLIPSGALPADSPLAALVAMLRAEATQILPRDLEQKYASEAWPMAAARIIILGS
ncbi:hypothetical protein PproGo58_30380 [Pseudomonas protegens]|nr:hypothetical protein PproGo58_30380 [Pseudomonas protegens]